MPYGAPVPTAANVAGTSTILTQPSGLLIPNIPFASDNVSTYGWIDNEWNLVPFVASRDVVLDAAIVSVRNALGAGANMRAGFWTAELPREGGPPSALHAFSPKVATETVAQHTIPFPTPVTLEAGVLYYVGLQSEIPGVTNLSTRGTFGSYPLFGRTSYTDEPPTKIDSAGKGDIDDPPPDPWPFNATFDLGSFAAQPYWMYRLV